MAKTEQINVRMERELKRDVESVLRATGLSVSDAVRIYFRQIQLRRGIPFRVEIPNEETLKAMRDAEQGQDLTSHRSPEDMFSEWDEAS